MPLIRQNQGNLIGGVSQQPSALRNTNECIEAENCFMSPVDGLMKRPPTELVAPLGATPAVEKYHTIYRDSGEQYLLRITPSGVSGVNLQTGSPITVTDPDFVGYTYLTLFDDETDLEVMTVSDTTFVVNKNKVVSMEVGTTSPAIPPRAFLFLRQGDYSSTYTVKLRIDGITYSNVETTTWKGTGTPAAGELGTIQTDGIIGDLTAKIIALGVPGLTATQKGSVVELEFAAGATINYIETEDSIGDSVLSSIYKSVPRVEGWLPEVCRDGHKVEVVGDGEIDVDNYWVEFQADGEDSGILGKGKWAETVAPEVKTTINAGQMPHILANTGVDTFEWLRPNWGDRTVGDEDTNPDPTFVGLRISNVFFYKNRLGFLAENQICMSEVGEYYNFFRATMLTLRDTEAINVTTNHTKVTMFRNSVPFNENMMLFSDRGQFILKGSDILSPRTVQILPVSEFESDPLPNPEPTAKSVYFAFQRGQQAGLREIFQTGDILTFDAVDVTDRVPNYIPGRVLEMYSSTLENILLVRTDGADDTLFVYKYFWTGDQRAQSSWSKWTFPGANVVVKHAAFVENDLYIVIDRDGTLYLEKVTIATGTVDTGLTMQVLLDRRITDEDLQSTAYSTPDAETTLTLPSGYTLAAGDTPWVVRQDTAVALTVTSSTATTVVVKGDHTTTDLYIGTQYGMSYEFTEPLVRIPVGNGTLGDYDTPQKVRYVRLQFADSAAFKVDVTIGNRATRTVEYSAFGPDLPIDTLDDVNTDRGEFRVPIRGNAKETLVVLRNDTPYPSNFTSATWEIVYRDRAGRR